MIPRLVPEISPCDGFCDGRTSSSSSRNWVFEELDVSLLKQFFFTFPISKSFEILHGNLRSCDPLFLFIRWQLLEEVLLSQWKKVIHINSMLNQIQWSFDKRGQWSIKRGFSTGINVIYFTSRVNQPLLNPHMKGSPRPKCHICQMRQHGLIWSNLLECGISWQNAKLSEQQNSALCQTLTKAVLQKNWGSGDRSLRKKLP